MSQQQMRTHLKMSAMDDEHVDGIMALVDPDGTRALTAHVFVVAKCVAETVAHARPPVPATLPPALVAILQTPPDPSSPAVPVPLPVPRRGPSASVGSSEHAPPAPLRSPRPRSPRQSPPPSPPRHGG